MADNEAGGNFMEKKNALLQLLDFSIEMKDDLDRKLTPEAKNAAGTWDIWSAKDGLAHIAHWIEVDLNNMEGAGPAIVVNEHDLDDANKKIYETWKAKSWDEVDRYYRKAFDRAKKAVESKDTAGLLEEVERGDGSTRPMWQSIAGHGLSHVVSHIDLIYRRRGEADYANALEEKAAELLRNIDDDREWQGTVQYNLACNYALTGSKGRALSLLKEALELNPKLTEWSKKDPDFSGIRGDPAFLKIVGAE